MTLQPILQIVFVVVWFLQHEVRRLHRLVGNAVVDGYHLLVGTGSTQLFQAALSPAADGKPMSVVSPAPYYSVRKNNRSSILQLTCMDCVVPPLGLFSSLTSIHTTSVLRTLIRLVIKGVVSIGNV
jgi:hypothetical protein